jgi:hypothetical protein
MEPMVVFSAGLVVYCSYRALVDAFHDLRREQVGESLKAAIRRVRARRKNATLAAVSGIKRSLTIVATCQRGSRQMSANCLAWQRRSVM